jgi:thermostable 8-oxoguanine DNA glycosylase
MEQEPERELLSSAVKRIGYKLRLASHFIFIVLAFSLVILSTVILILKSF